jgi:hypothetical protein
MVWRKLLAIAFALGILGAQLYVMIPPRRYLHWYWPFLDYPMYSDVHDARSAYAQQRLRGVPCDAGAEQPLTAEDLRLRKDRLIYLMRAAVAWESADHYLRTFTSPAGSAAARVEVLTKTRERQRGRFCSVKVQERAFPVGKPVPPDLERLWHDLWQGQIP